MEEASTAQESGLEVKKCCMQQKRCIISLLHVFALCSQNIITLDPVFAAIRWHARQIVLKSQKLISEYNRLRVADILEGGPHPAGGGLREAGPSKARLPGGNGGGTLSEVPRCFPHQLLPEEIEHSLSLPGHLHGLLLCVFVTLDNHRVATRGKLTEKPGTF